MRKIKILQFPIANSYGGITHYALDNWKWMDKDKFQCDFATMSKKLDFAQEILETGSKIHYISCYAEADEEKFIKEVNAILDEHYDVVHLHTKQWKSFLVEKLCIEKNVPKIIVHSHSTKCNTSDDEKREWETKEHYRVRENFDESLATDFWACSKDAAEWLFGDKIDENKIVIMNNAIEADKFVFDNTIREEYREKYNLKNKFVIGNVGRLAFEKNQAFLLDVFSEVRKEVENAVLVLIGDGNLRVELEKKATELKIDKNVFFMGKQSQINEFYQMMDLFVLPSLFEGLPLSLVEAQTAGLKCLCSDTITKEAGFAGNVEYLPLEVASWKKKIVEMQHEYERINMYDAVTAAGYNIREQIHVIEREYEREY